MKYVKFTKIDSETGLSINLRSPVNSVVDPDIKGLTVVFQDANITEFWYGTADDTAKDNPDNQCWIVTKEQFTEALSSTILKHKQEMLKEIGVRDKAIREEILGYYHSTALIAGTYKLEQAKLHLAGIEDSKDMLHVEANLRGISVDTLANKIIEKYNKYVYIDALITGIRGKLEDRIEGFVVDPKDPLASWDEFLSVEDVGNGILLPKYGTDIYGRMLPLL